MADRFTKKFRGELVKSSKKALKAKSVRFFNEVVQRTPVDTGAARNSWEISNISDEGVDVSNNVGYITILNDGHSKQAPEGFIEQAIAITKEEK